MTSPKANSTTQTPKLSIVIGSHNGISSVRECLDALESQRSSREIEVIIVDNSTDGGAEILQTRRSENLTLIEAPVSALIPQLWGIGVRQSSGAIIATTTSHFIPRSDWIEQILLAHESQHAGIGGAIENDDSAGLVEWALYFCRYSSFMPPFVEKEAVEIAADNASYKRSALGPWLKSDADGFWEPLIHADFRKRGLSLSINPSIVITHRKSFGLADFVLQRFRHGRQFGGSRAVQLSQLRRSLYILLSPLIPLLLMARIARPVVIKRKRFGKFLLSLPILSIFLLSWTAGELCGYLLGNVEKR